jgi:hypothetical protein
MMTKNQDFTKVINLIKTSKQDVYKKINTTLIELYWNIGRYISLKTIKENWGKGIVKELANFIQEKEPTITGFSDKNLWRMKQFYEAYHQNEKLSTVLTQLLKVAMYGCF